MVKKWKKYGKQGGVLLLFLLLTFVFYMKEKQESENFSIERIREAAGNGVSKETLHMQVEEFGIDTEVEISIPEQIYGEEDRNQLFHNAYLEVMDQMFASGDSADAVRKDLTLPKKLQDGLIEAEYHFDNYEVVTIQGKRKEENIPQEGILVELRMTFSYEDYQDIIYQPLYFLPQQETAQTTFWSQYDAYMEKEGEEENTEIFSLPLEAAGTEITWSAMEDHRYLCFPFLGLLFVGLMNWKEKEAVREKRKLREEALLEDYPEIVLQLSLLVGAGMTLNQGFQRIGQQYQNRIARKEMPKRPAYEEILTLLHEMQDGVPERSAYEHMAEKCNLRVYRKFMSILVQNLRKGTKGLAEILEGEAEDAFVIRKNTILKKSEEAGTKLLFPMLLMLGVVMVIVLVPALLSFQY